MSLHKRISHHFQTFATEYAIVIVTMLIGASFAIYINSQSLTRVYPDQNAHLNIARQIIDSRTPGVSQLGYWPPILHLAMAPFTMNTYLYESGLAAAAAIVPIVASSAVFLYWLVMSFTPNKARSLVIVGVYIFNPYFLYYATTPMSESLFIAILIMLAYWLIRWYETESLLHLTVVSLLTAVSSLARFEGLMLIPAIVAIVAVVLMGRKTSWVKLEAVSVLFLSLASIGVGFILIHGWIFADNPLEFATGRWSASAQAEGLETVTSGSLMRSGFYAGYASYLMLGPLFELLIGLGIVTLFLTPRPMRMRLFIVLCVGAAPLALLILSLWNGDTYMTFPTLPPFEPLYNERYGLQAYGFAILVLVATCAMLESRIQTSLFSRASIAAGTVAAFVALFVQITFFSYVVFADDLKIIRGTQLHSVVPDEEEAGRYLASIYKGGSVLMTRALNHGVSVAAGIPLSEYIYEGNVPAYPDANMAPWKHAVYVVMQNQDIEWRKKNDLILSRWKDSEEFQQHYYLAFENPAALIYVRKNHFVFPAL